MLPKYSNNPSMLPQRIAKLTVVTAALAVITPVVSWVPPVRSNRPTALLLSQTKTTRSKKTNKPQQQKNDGTILDAEILDERLDGKNDQLTANDVKQPAGKSLFDISSMDDFADGDLKEMRIPFLDMTQEKSIDVRLAFMANVDGVEYGIGVPFDAAAAILADEVPENEAFNKNRRAVIPDPTKKLNFISPDDEAGEEMMSIMATQLHEQVSTDLKLIRTPRVLTISGPIDDVTDRWKEELLPKPFSVQELLDPLEEEEKEDDGAAYFLDFMRKELGDAAVDKVMSEDPDPDLMTDEIMEFFNMPTKEEIEKDLHEPEKVEKEIEDTLGNIDKDVVGLRLVAYFLADGSSYSLVKLLKPVSLVAKYVDSRFEFLTPQEQDMVVPKLQQLYQGDLESAGLQLEQ